MASETNQNPDTTTVSVITDGADCFVKSGLTTVADIDDSGRLRPVDSVVVEGLAASMAREGLLNPIDVCQLPGRRGFLLVAGAHRLAAARLLGWMSIPVFVRSANALERRSREIAENLFKADLMPLDRAAFVSELIEVEKARMGIEGAVDGRASNSDYRSGKYTKKQMTNDLCIVHKSMGLQEKVAERLGLHRATVSRDLSLNGIAPSFLPRVRALPGLASNASALRKLASLHWKKQAEVLDELEAEPKRKFAEAVAIVTQAPVPDPEKKRLSTFVGTFARMGRKEKLAALAALARMMPTGAEVVFSSASERVEAAQDAARLMHKAVESAEDEGGSTE